MLGSGRGGRRVHERIDGYRGVLGRVPVFAFQPFGWCGWLLGPVSGSGRVVLVWNICVDGTSRYMYIVLVGYLRIFSTPNVQSYCTLSIYVSNRIFVSG